MPGGRSVKMDCPQPAFRHCPRQTVSVIRNGLPWMGRSQNRRCAELCRAGETT